LAQYQAKKSEILVKIAESSVFRKICSNWWRFGPNSSFLALFVGGRRAPFGDFLRGRPPFCEVNKP
jgi:hypothetical protein